MRLASQISGESHQNATQHNSLDYVRSSRVSNDDVAQPELAFFCCEEARKLLAGVAEEVLHLNQLLVLLDFF